MLPHRHKTHSSKKTQHIIARYRGSPRTSKISSDSFEINLKVAVKLTVNLIVVAKVVVNLIVAVKVMVNLKMAVKV